MLGEKWTIYWNEYVSDTYLYGSEVKFHNKNQVEFHNELMPPGTVIKQWYSKTNFWAQRKEPALPIIDGETEYILKVNIDVPENENITIRLAFFDRYGVEAGYLNIREKETRFRCPLKTYSYNLQLINSGVTRFTFHSIILQEVIDEEE
ncbi:MAG: accessory Sec system protein Asp3 [Lachnospiraceae bacterium]|nr:accessory Sec system protein Asp3 [Lachnospiraceae bacterium]